MKVSVVIPTRNRPASLLRLLRSLNDQDYPLREVIIVDSSDERIGPCELRHRFPELKIACYDSAPSVCMQRNLGIRKSTSPFVFLCDDDVELPPDYVSRLMSHLRQDAAIGAITGLILETNDRGHFRAQFPTTSFTQLLWNFIFQLTVWTDMSQARTTVLNSAPLYLIRKFYAWRGNTFTLAGWPLVSQFNGVAFQTSVYGLGASIVRRQWLVESPFDEILDRHGIGDNYGVAVSFPSSQAITVVTNVHAWHHRDSNGRLARELAYFRRILALQYFMAGSERFGVGNQVWLVWSLLGNLLSHWIRGESALARAAWVALRLILSGKNPYVVARRQGNQSVINPVIE